MLVFLYEDKFAKSLLDNELSLLGNLMAKLRGA